MRRSWTLIFISPKLDKSVAAQSEAVQAFLPLPKLPGQNLDPVLYSKIHF
jgi:hypothetical protein